MTDSVIVHVLECHWEKGQETVKHGCSVNLLYGVPDVTLLFLNYLIIIILSL